MFSVVFIIFKLLTIYFVCIYFFCFKNSNINKVFFKLIKDF